MASMALTTTFSNLQPTRSASIINSPRSSRAFVGVSTRPFPVHYVSNASRRFVAMATSEASDAANDAVKDGIEAVKSGNQEAKEAAIAAAENVAQKNKDVAGIVSDSAQDAAGKATKDVENAWGSFKDTAQKIEDAVLDKAEETTKGTKETISEGAEKIKEKANN